MTLKNYRDTLSTLHQALCIISNHRWIKTEVTVWKHSIRVKIGKFLSCVILKFDGWPRKTIEHLFFATWSFVHHFKAIAEFKLELQFRNARFGSKSAILFYSGDFTIWQMTLKSNRAPLVYWFKLGASFQSHQWIQTKVTVRKRLIRVKIGDFLSCVTLEIDRWPWKTIRHLFYATLSFVHYFTAMIQTGVTVRKRQNLVQLGDLCRVTLKFDGWPWKTEGNLF